MKHVATNAEMKQGAGGRPSVFERLEAAAGITLWAISSCSMIAGSVWTVVRAPSRPESTTNVPLFVAIAILSNMGTVASGWFIFRAFAAARSPLLLGIADRQPRFSQSTVTIVVTWWSWHFLSMTVAADLFWEECRVRFTTLPQGFTATLIRFALTVSASAAANLFLLLALGAALPGSSILRLVYRMRFVLDLVVAVALLSVPPMALLIFRVPFMFLFRIVFHR